MLPLETRQSKMKKRKILIFVIGMVGYSGLLAGQKLTGQELGNSFQPSAAAIIAPSPVVPTPPQVDAMWGYRTPATYFILPRPASHRHKNQPNTYQTPVNPVESKPIEPYAYGWFGTKYSPQWHRQFGHQKDYTQWTLK